jgi:hypothetical protein
MLLTIEEIQKGLAVRFTHNTFDLSRFHLRQPGISADALRSLATGLGVCFAGAFAEIVTQYDLSKLTLMNLGFAYGPNLARFVGINIGKPYPSWWRGEKPANAIWICATDGHFLTMDVLQGTIHAFTKADGNAKGMVAIDFGFLIRGAGTMAIRETGAERSELAEMVSRDVGAPGNSFWHQLINRTA